MTDDVFKVFYTGLLCYYNKDKKETTAEINRAYYEALKAIPDAQQGDFFKKLINTFVYFPKIAEIRELLPKPRPAVFRNRTLCWYCMDLGYIPYIKSEFHGNIQRTYEYVAQCPVCEAGRAYSKAPSYARLFGEADLKDVQERNRENFGDIDQAAIDRAKEKFSRIVRAVSEGARI